MTNDLNQLDLRLSGRYPGQLISDRELVDFSIEKGDLATSQGLGNLAQAIVNRLCTRKGELAALGHPDYGSRLYQLVGELNNTRTRALAELYIRECLVAEPRVEEIIKILFDSPSWDYYNRNTLNVTLIVKPVAEETPLTLSLSLNL